MTERVRAARLPIAGLALLLLLTGCGSDVIVTATPSGGAGGSAACPGSPVSSDKFTETAPLTTRTDGLQYGDLSVGTGAVPQKGDTLSVQYTGWLVNGCVFDTSRQPGRTAFSFLLGATPAQVIAGWEEGLASMHVSGRRRLVIPPALAYGASGQGSIPPNATIIFDVQLMGVSSCSASGTPSLCAAPGP